MKVQSVSPEGRHVHPRPTSEEAVVALCLYTPCLEGAQEKPLGTELVVGFESAAPEPSPRPLQLLANERVSPAGHATGYFVLISA